MALPTIGRRVYFKINPETLQPGQTFVDPAQPFDAGVLFVHPDGTVNLSVTTHHGTNFYLEGVPFHEGDTPNPGEAYWMPHQLEQQATQATAPVL